MVNNCRRVAAHTTMANSAAISCGLRQFNSMSAPCGASTIGTMMAVNTVGHLAEAAWHHPEIAASYPWVEVSLQSHDAKGITDKDFALAQKIEEVVQWQPAKESGVLEGTPANDERYAYIKYDA